MICYVLGMKEQWKAVVDYEGRYEVSSKGRVRSLRSRHGLRKKPLLLKQQPGDAGHLMVGLYDGNGRRIGLVHRLMLEAFVGPCPDGQQCCHKDDRPENNTLKNLRWDTPAGNSRDAVRNGRLARGERHGLSKLTKEIVADCRSRREEGETWASLAEDYDVHYTTIQRAVEGETWT